MLPSPRQHPLALLPFLQHSNELSKPVPLHLSGLPQSLGLCYLSLPAFLLCGVWEPARGEGRGKRSLRPKNSHTCLGQWQGQP